jgi:hypothetical protein
MGFDADNNPFTKYCLQREKTLERVVRKEEAIFAESEEDDEPVLKITKNKLDKVQVKDCSDNEMDEDLVEDFELSDLSD